MSHQQVLDTIPSLETVQFTICRNVAPLVRLSQQQANIPFFDMIPPAIHIRGIHVGAFLTMCTKTLNHPLTTDETKRLLRFWIVQARNHLYTYIMQLKESPNFWSPTTVQIAALWRTFLDYSYCKLACLHFQHGMVSRRSLKPEGQPTTWVF